VNEFFQALEVAVFCGRLDELRVRPLVDIPDCYGPEAAVELRGERAPRVVAVFRAYQEPADAQIVLQACDRSPEPPRARSPWLGGLHMRGSFDSEGFIMAASAYACSPGVIRTYPADKTARSSMQRSRCLRLRSCRQTDRNLPSPWRSPCDHILYEHCSRPIRICAFGCGTDR
jgi:hypothetical protein